MPANPDASRIRLKEALRRLAPYMKKSSFYGTTSNPGPRWTMAQRLGIRESRSGITLDAEAFYKWLAELAGPLATRPHPVSYRLVGGQRSANMPQSYGDKVAVLCAARERGCLSEERFRRALEALDEVS